MKQLVIQIAMALIAENGKTTTLEVKNKAHEQNSTDPSFSLTQGEVSQFMSEMYREANGDISRDFNSNGPGFYEYSMTPAAVPGMNLGTGSVKSTTTSPGIKPRSVHNVPVCLGSVDNLNGSEDTNLYVAFESTNPDSAFLFDTTDRFEARAGYKTVVTNYNHDNIRMMRLKHYQTKYVTA